MSGSAVVSDSAWEIRQEVDSGPRDTVLSRTEPSRRSLMKVFFPPNHVLHPLVGTWGFPGGSDGRESACNTVDLGSGPGFSVC